MKCSFGAADQEPINIYTQQTSMYMPFKHVLLFGGKMLQRRIHYG